MYTDRDGNHVSPLFTWQDQRGGLPHDGSGTYAGHVSEMTGYPVSPGFGIVTHYYHIRQGLVPESAAALCTIADYVAMKLADQVKPVMDYTMAASLGCFNVQKLEFPHDALHRMGIDAGMLPETVPSGTPAGMYDGRIPVACALGDNQASVLGSVNRVEKSVLVNVGTGGQVSVYSPGFAQVDGLETRPFPGGGYILVGASLTGGKSYAMLENFFRQVCEKFTHQPVGSLYEQMSLIEIETLDRSDKLEVDTQFLGTRRHPGKRGSIRRISMSNFTPEHLIAGFLEGIAKELHDFYLLIPASLRKQIDTLVGAGNGIRKNESLSGIIAQTFGLPLHIPRNMEEASYGAALCAGVGCGYFDDFVSAGSVILYGQAKVRPHR